MIHAGLSTTRDFVKEHRDRVRSFLQAYMEAVKFASTNPKETKQVIGKYTKTTNEEDLEETYQTFIKVWERVPYVSGPAVQSVLNFTRHPGAKTAKPEEFIDNSILAELDRKRWIRKAALRALAGLAIDSRFRKFRARPASTRKIVSPTTKVLNFISPKK
jgi:hypothetical protein